MKMLSLTLQGSGKRLTIVINGTIAIAESTEKGHTTITDGTHNNGGWEVKESYEEIITQLEKLSL